MAETSEPQIESADAHRRLATYGTLAPGRPNHHHLDGLDGRWFDGTSTPPAVPYRHRSMRCGWRRLGDRCG